MAQGQHGNQFLFRKPLGLNGQLDVLLNLLGIKDANHHAGDAIETLRKALGVA